MSINLKSIISQQTNIAQREIAGQYVLVRAPLSVMYTINEVGAVAWEAIEGAVTVQTLVDRVIKEFDITTETAEADVLEFLEDLAKNDLIEVADSE